MKELDLVAALGRHFQAMNTDRGDGRFSHISDVAKCQRQVAMRRRGFTPMAFDPEASARMEAGRRFERDVIAALQNVNAGWTWDNYRVLWNPATDEFRNEQVEDPEPGWAVGHLDAVEVDITQAPVHTYEAKSTGGYPRKDGPSEHYKAQIKAYCAAVKTNGTLIVEYRGSGQKQQFEFVVDERVRAAMREEMLEVMRVTDPAAPLPPAEPRYHWECGYCDYDQCEKNPAYDMAEVPF